MKRRLIPIELLIKAMNNSFLYCNCLEVDNMFFFTSLVVNVCFCIIIYFLNCFLFEKNIILISSHCFFMYQYKNYKKNLKIFILIHFQLKNILHHNIKYTFSLKCVWYYDSFHGCGLKSRKLILIVVDWIKICVCLKI